MRRVPKRVILHCSATADYPHDNAAFDLIGYADIDRWHRERGFSGCGYHWIIRRTGIIEAGRPETKIGAHVKGHNVDSIGICYVGTNYPTVNQIEALYTLYGRIFNLWKIDHTNWYGHYEFTDKKTCPGNSMVLVRELLKQWHFRLVG